MSKLLYEPESDTFVLSSSAGEDVTQDFYYAMFQRFQPNTVGEIFAVNGGNKLRFRVIVLTDDKKVVINGKEI